MHAAFSHAQGQPLLAVQPPEDDEGETGKEHYVLALGNAGTAADAHAARLEVVRQARILKELPLSLYILYQESHHALHPRTHHRALST